MAGEIETLKRIKEAEEESAKRVAEAEDKAKKEIADANIYRDTKLAEAEESGKGYHEKAIAAATTKALEESKKVIEDAKARAKSIKHLDSDKALEIFEDEVLLEFGV